MQREEGMEQLNPESHKGKKIGRSKDLTGYPQTWQ